MASFKRLQDAWHSVRRTAWIVPRTSFIQCADVPVSSDNNSETVSDKQAWTARLKGTAGHMLYDDTYRQGESCRNARRMASQMGILPE